MKSILVEFITSPKLNSKIISKILKKSILDNTFQKQITTLSYSSNEGMLIIATSVGCPTKSQ